MNKTHNHNLNLDDFRQFQKHLAAGRLRTAALILYLRCLKNNHAVDLDILYDNCWRKTLQVAGRTK